MECMEPVPPGKITLNPEASSLLGLVVVVGEGGG